MTNYDSNTIEKDEVLERLMEKKRYKDAYQRCIELINEKEHVSYAKLTMRSLIDKIDVKEHRKDIWKIVLFGFVLILFLFAWIICVYKFRLNEIVTGIAILVLVFVAFCILVNWVQIIRWYEYDFVKGIRMVYTPQVTIEKICNVLKESLPYSVPQIQKNVVDIKDELTGVKARIRLNQNEKRFTTIVVEIFSGQLITKPSDKVVLMRNILTVLKDGIPNMIDGFSEPVNRPKRKKAFGIVLAVVAAAAIAAILFFSNPQYQPGRSLTNSSNGHEWVDLGLPSSTLWATCNVGATSPEGYGNYYAWGETVTKDSYLWENYDFAMGSSYDDPRLTKYCNKPRYGDNDFTDKIKIMQNGDDPAFSWGNGWHTPSKMQWDELLKNTTTDWTTRNGVQGQLFTSNKNGQTLFFPAAGYHLGDEFSNADSCGCYWSSSLYTDDTRSAWCYVVSSKRCYMHSLYRINGLPVRPVRQK